MADFEGILGPLRNGIVLFQDTLVVEEGGLLGLPETCCEFMLTCPDWGSYKVWMKRGC